MGGGSILESQMDIAEEYGQCQKKREENHYINLNLIKAGLIAALNDCLFSFFLS